VDGGNGQCYAVLTQSSAFTDAVEAQELCHNNDSELASIPDDSTEALVLGMIRNATVTVLAHARRDEIKWNKKSCLRFGAPDFVTYVLKLRPFSICG